ncbi:MAG: exodeoxyribonuclease VII small subunit [Deltaproteobacteria bacterium]|nr:exodeoxyribonuclease VII small subunit [Deltaproteobacteria bacterium]MCW5808665.1 exodeoxyribonuclease VII small subunit [Deltaproteobacteria bacterium]
MPAMAEEPSFDQIVARLREVVARLESGELSLEQSLQVYEEGVQLARRGQQLLAAAEKRVEILVSASGAVEVAPFELHKDEDDKAPRPAPRLATGSTPG